MAEIGSHRPTTKFSPPGWSGWPNPGGGLVWPRYDENGQDMTILGLTVNMIGGTCMTT